MTTKTTFGELTIEKGIPIPPPRGKPGLTPVLHALEIGDSVLVRLRTQQQVSNVCARMKTRYGKVFVTRRTKEGIRVWRVA